jgi:hypothetical protein
MRKSSIVILLVAVGFAALVFVLLLRANPVKVVNDRLIRRGGRVYVAGELRNTSARRSGWLDLEIHYYDRGGRPLGEDTLHLSPLKAGAEERFHGPLHDLGTVADFSLYLNHGRDPYGN